MNVFESLLRDWETVQTLQFLNRSKTNMAEQNDAEKYDGPKTMTSADLTIINSNDITTSDTNTISNSSFNIGNSPITLLQKMYNRDPLIKNYKSLEGIAYKKYKANDIEFYCCLNCNQYMKTFSAICNHINKHRNATPYKCISCSNQYTTRRVLYRHFKDKHDSTSTSACKVILHKCPICNENFVDKQIFFKHVSTEILYHSKSGSYQSINNGATSQQSINDGSTSQPIIQFTAHHT